MNEQTLVVRLQASLGSFRAEMGAAAGEVRSFGRVVATSTGDAARGFDLMGKAAIATGAVIATGFAMSAKAAIDFESAFASVQKTVDGTDQELDDIRDGIRGLAREMPTTAGEIARVAASAGALGVATPDVLRFSEVMVKLGEATDDLPADAAAVSMARFMNIMQTAPGDVERLASTLVDLGNNGASTEGQIMEMATRIASAGRQVGMTESDVLALANALSSVGQEAEAGGSSMSRVIIEMQNAVMGGGEALETFASTAGMSAEAFASSFRRAPAEAIVDFVEGLRRLQSQGVNTNAVLEDLGLADIRVGNAVRSLAGGGDLLRESLDLGAKAFADNAALALEYERRLDTVAGQLGILRNNVVDLAIGLGTALLPAIRLGVTITTDLVQAFASMPGPLQLIVAIGAGLVGTVTLLAGGFLLLGPRVSEAVVAFNLLATTAPRVAAGLRLITVASGVVGVAIAALTTAYALFGNETEDVTDQTNEMTGAFEAMNAAGREAAAQKILETLATDGLLSKLNELGITGAAVAEIMTTHADGSAKNVRAMQEWRAALDEALESGRITKDEYDEISKRVFALGNDYSNLAGASDDVTAAERALGIQTSETGGAFADQAFDIDAATDALDKYNAMLDATLGLAFGVAEAEDQVAGRIAEMEGRIADAADERSSSYDRVADAADRVAEAEERLAEAREDAVGKAGEFPSGQELRRIADAERDLARARKDQAKASADAAGDVDSFSTSLDRTTEAGLENREFFRGWTEDIADVAREMMEAGKSPQEITDYLLDQRGALEDNATRWGFAKEALKEYVKVLDDIIWKTVVLQQVQAGPAAGSVDAGIADRNAMHGFGFARGGYVPGSGDGDTVPAMLTPGEYVLRKAVVQRIGVSNLERVNRYADGGLVRLPHRGPGGAGGIDLGQIIAAMTAAGVQINQTNHFDRSMPTATELDVANRYLADRVAVATGGRIH